MLIAVSKFRINTDGSIKPVLWLYVKLSLNIAPTIMLGNTNTVDTKFIYIQELVPGLYLFEYIERYELQNYYYIINTSYTPSAYYFNKYTLLTIYVNRHQINLRRNMDNIANTYVPDNLTTCIYDFIDGSIVKTATIGDYLLCLLGSISRSSSVLTVDIYKVRENYEEIDPQKVETLTYKFEDSLWESGFGNSIIIESKYLCDKTVIIHKCLGFLRETKNSITANYSAPIILKTFYHILPTYYTKCTRIYNCWFHFKKLN